MKLDKQGVNGGSSPQMRGALARPTGDVQVIRIIPADAGSTVPDSGKALRTRDHPRRCGEHFFDSRISISSRGSSPQMRGALSPGPRVAVKPGIIPADAGSTSMIWLI